RAIVRPVSCAATGKRLLDAEHVGQHLRCMIARIDLVVYAFDSSAGVDKKAHALRVPGFSAVAGAVGHSNLMRGIAEQPEAEVVFAREGGVVGDAVETDAEHHNCALVKILAVIAQAAPLQTATRRVGLWKKPQQDPATAQLRQLKLPTVVGR